MAAQGARFVIGLLSAVVLARLLRPEDFGIVGMVATVTGFLALFKDAGLSAATIQSQDITSEQVSSLFWANLLLGCGICLTACALAPGVAWFYGDSRLTAVMLVLSFAFVLGGLTVQHNALLRRHMQFNRLAGVEVAASVISTAFGIVLALLGSGYWSLVGMQLCLAAVTLILTWLASGWKPSRPSFRSGIRPLLNFGANVTAANALVRIVGSSDEVLVGKLFGEGSLGLYTRAQALVERPIDQLSGPVSTVLIPMLSRLRSDRARYRNTFVRVYTALAMLTFPMTALLFALAEPIVLVVLGNNWIEAAPIFAGFALSGVSMSLAFPVSWLLISQGRDREMLRAYSILSILVIVAFLAGLPWGPEGIVLSYAFYGLTIRLPILYHLVGRSGPVTAKDLWTGFLSNAPSWLAAYFGASLTFAAFVDNPMEIALPSALVAGFFTACLTHLCLRRSRDTAFTAFRAIRTAFAQN